mmetsp:Transcript_1093/g.2012  ORF Transcript_1093/g.2012 Transcript_1093/m.2012 type:complete len:102 (-) Transcript_1093:98-403(-)
MPNLMMMSALAVQRKLEGAEQEEFKDPNEKIKRAVDLINKCVKTGSPRAMFDIDPEKEEFKLLSSSQILLTLLLYPQMLAKLIDRAGKKQLSQKFSKSYYT